MKKIKYVALCAAMVVVFSGIGAADEPCIDGQTPMGKSCLVSQPNQPEPDVKDKGVFILISEWLKTFF